MGLPPDAAIWRHQASAPPEQSVSQRRQTSSPDTIRKIGGKVIEIRRDKAG
jgi:hypothetical protein